MGQERGCYGRFERPQVAGEKCIAGGDQTGPSLDFSNRNKTVSASARTKVCFLGKRTELDVVAQTG
jgi:hypothetical protein